MNGLRLHLNESDYENRVIRTESYTYINKMQHILFFGRSIIETIQ